MINLKLSKIVYCPRTGNFKPHCYNAGHPILNWDNTVINLYDYEYVKNSVCFKM